MTFYHRKLYALLRSPEVTDRGEIIVQQLTCLDGYRDELAAWWERSTNSLQVSQRIATSSDRLNLPSRVPAEIRVCHPISGQNQTIQALDFEQLPDYSDILQEEDVEKVFWWFWRLFPERIAQTQPDALLFPAHFVLPDCPLHSYQSTTSALTGALFPKDYQPGQPNCPPYLLLFSFSPVQEFIKASRKFLDFWAGSYLLHYLSARLCWYVAQQLGPDAIITPSLWSQEIIDTFLCQKYPDFKAALATLHSSQNLQGHDPVQRWQHRQSTSLSTAGFPNAIVVLVAGKPAAQALGKALSEQLVQEWTQIGTLIQQDIRSRIGAYAAKVMSHTQEWDKLWQKLQQDFENADDPQVYQRDLGLWQARPQPLSTDPQHCIYANWQWRELWEVQLKNTWEPYWTAIPLGKAQADLLTRW